VFSARLFCRRVTFFAVEGQLYFRSCTCTLLRSQWLRAKRGLLCVLLLLLLLLLCDTLSFLSAIRVAAKVLTLGVKRPGCLVRAPRLLLKGFGTACTRSAKPLGDRACLGPNLLRQVLAVQQLALLLLLDRRTWPVFAIKPFSVGGLQLSKPFMFPLVGNGRFKFRGLPKFGITLGHSLELFSRERLSDVVARPARSSVLLRRYLFVGATQIRVVSRLRMKPYTGHRIEVFCVGAGVWLNGRGGATLGLPGSCPIGWCKSADPRSGPKWAQAATAGSLTSGSSLTGFNPSSVM